MAYRSSTRTTDNNNQNLSINRSASDKLMRQTGIEVIGEVPWGTHFCQFYQTKQDLIDTLVPYFQAGLESNEFCMWITSEPLAVDEAKQALRELVPDIDRRIVEGQIEIISYTDWYLLGGSFDQKRVLDGWVQKLEAALAKGYSGLRLTGNTFWLEKKDWSDFTDYEEAVNAVIGDYRILALCTYSLEKCGASEIADVVINHEFAMMKRSGEWSIIESSTVKEAKRCLQSALNHVSLVNQELQETESNLRDEIERRKQVEHALTHSEQQVRLKLESILSPESDLSNLELTDILDIEAIQSLMNSFYQLARIPMAMLDLKGTVLIGVGWQDICLRFHRVHPETCRHCIESDTKLTVGVLPGEFRLYKCKNNMWDVSTPVIIAGQHIANLFSGQFFFDDEPIDYELFRKQARKYGFDEDDYLGALDNVPRLSRKSVSEAMAFFIKLADMLSKLSYSNMKLARSLAERERLTDSLRESEDRLSRAQEIAHLGSWELDLVTNHLSWSDEAYRVFGLEPQEFKATYEAFLNVVHPDDRAAVDAAYSGSITEGKSSYEIEHRIVKRHTGEVRTVHEKCEHIRDENGAIIRSIGMTQDITERKLAEIELKRTNQRLNLLSETANRLLITDNPQQIVQSLCEQVMEHLDCQVFVNYLVDSQHNCLNLNACSGIPDEAVKKLEWLDFGTAVCGCVAKDGCRIIAENIAETPDPRTELVKSMGVTAYACHPLLEQGGSVIGTLSFGTKTRSTFNPSELDLMRTIADQVATAMEKLRLLESEKRHVAEQEELLQRERHIAEVLQQALVPAKIALDVPGYTITTRYEPALKEASVGGDFYDVFDLGDGRFAVLIGDVAGKGLAAAIRVAAARHSIRSYAYLDHSPAAVLTLANKAMAREEWDEGNMLTAFLAVVDVRNNVVTYANGGHEPPMICRAGGDIEELYLEGGALGFHADFDYSEAYRELQPGDLILMVTDGITEARTNRIELFDKAGIVRYLANNHRSSPDDIAEGLLHSAKEFAGGRLQDDAAIIVVRRDG